MKNIDLTKFGSKIRDTRKGLKMTQKELSERLCTQGYLSRLEKGEYTPALPVYFGICKKLGVDPESFYKSSEMMEKDNYVKGVMFGIRKAAAKRDYEFILKNVKLEIDNPAFEGNREKQFLLWHLGIGQYYLEKDFEGAINSLNEALTYSKRTSGIIYDYYLEVLLSKAVILSDEKRYEESISIYHLIERSLNSLMDIDDLKFAVRFYYNFARLTNMLGEFNASISLVNEGISLCLKHEILYLLGDLHYLKAANYYDMKDFKKASESFQDSYFSYKLINNEKLIERTRQALEETNGLIE
jgi:transcriptional regulator with XRE-family HTH domain